MTSSQTKFVPIDRLAGGHSLPGARTVSHNIVRLAGLINAFLADYGAGVSSPPDHPLAADVALETAPAVEKKLHGYIDQYPAWAAAYVWRPESVFQRLQAAYIASFLLDPQRLSIGPGVATTREAGRFIRKLARSEVLLGQIASGLTRLPDDLHQLAKVLEEFAETLDGPANTAATCARSIARHIEYALQNRHPHQRRQSLRRVFRRDAEDEGGQIVSEEFAPPVGHAVTKARQAAAAAPDGESPSVRAFAIPSDLKPSPRDDMRFEFFRAKEKLRSLISAGQKLPFAGNRLQPPDLQVLLSWLSQEATLRSPEALQEDELRSVATLSLLAGKTPGDILAARVAGNLADGIAMLEKKSPGRIILVLAPWGILLSTPKPKNMFVPEKKEAELYRPVVQFLFVPLCHNFPGVARLMSEAKKRVGKKLFESDVVWHRDALEKQLQKLNRSGARLTSTRVGTFLSRLMTDFHHDQADAAFFYAGGEADDCAARLFYYGPLAQSLADKYRKVVEATLSARPPEATKFGSAPTRVPKADWSWLALPPQYIHSRVGSAGVPEVSRVRKAFRAVLQTNRAFRPDIRSRTQVVRFHNHYTAYTVLAVLWTTGIRAIKDPIEIDLLDLSQAFLGVSDKDHDEYPNARVVCLPEPLRLHLSHYQRHRDAILSRHIKFGIKNPPTTWLFFIEGENVEPVTPSALLEHLSPDFPFRASSQRHFLRTELRERGASGVDIDALLGHGALGEEAYGRYSCYSPIRLKRKLGPLLTDLAEELEIRPVRGLFARKRSA